jgi:carbamoyl-phosphate synthase large subunit
MAKMAAAKTTAVGPVHAGFTVVEIYNLTKIDRCFLLQIKEIVNFEKVLAATKN